MSKYLDLGSSKLNESDLSIIGITTTVDSFFLASEINKILGTKLTLKKDFESYNEQTNKNCCFKHYYYYHQPYHLHNSLMENRNIDGAFLFSSKSMFDFIYVLIGRDHLRHSKNFVEKVKKIDNVSLVQIIHPLVREEENKESKKSVTVHVINMFNEPSPLKISKPAKKKHIQQKLNLTNFFEDIDFNIDNIMNEHRLFIAFKVLLPDSMISKSKALCEAMATVPFTRTLSSNQHITLAFFGSVSAKRMKEITLVSENIIRGFEPIEVSFDRISFFKDKNSEMVFYFGIKDNPILNSLSQRLRKAYKDNCIFFDNKPFVPHVTICRLNKALLKEQEEVLFERIKVIHSSRQKITLSAPILFESISINGVLRYNICNRF